MRPPERDPARLQAGDAVIFIDVAGRERLTRVRKPPVMLGQVWFVELELGAGLFLAARVRLPDEPPLPPPRRAKAYAGIGSRRTPPEMLSIIRAAASHLAQAGFLLRSGAADGADIAAEDGARAAGGRCEIFVAWPGFNGRSPSHSEGVYCLTDAEINAQAMAIAASAHPAWDRLGRGPRALMARNAHQVLGPALDDPVAFVLCWAPKPVLRDGRVVNCDGGTGLAVRLAAARGIPVFNLAHAPHLQRIEQMLAGAAAGPPDPALNAPLP